METNYQPSGLYAGHHALNLTDRKNLELTGVKAIESFDNQEFLVETVLGHVYVKGTNLSLGKMDTENGEVLIKGTIESITYVSKKAQTEPKKSFTKRLFK